MLEDHFNRDLEWLEEDFNLGLESSEEDWADLWGFGTLAGTGGWQQRPTLPSFGKGHQLQPGHDLQASSSVPVISDPIQAPGSARYSFREEPKGSEMDGLITYFKGPRVWMTVSCCLPLNEADQS